MPKITLHNDNEEGRLKITSTNKKEKFHVSWIGVYTIRLLVGGGFCYCL
jgi:hypothetical protein